MRDVFAPFVAAGTRPLAFEIADLNRDGVRGPRGALWSPSTIHGNPTRGIFEATLRVTDTSGRSASSSATVWMPTLRSRSLAVFLGPAERVDPASVEPLARACTRPRLRRDPDGVACL